MTFDFVRLKKHKTLLCLAIILMVLMVTACGASEPANNKPTKTIETTAATPQEISAEGEPSKLSELKQQGSVAETPGKPLTAQPAAGQGGNGILRVHFLSTGNSDCIYLETPAGEHLLIDGADEDDGPVIVDYIKKQGVEKLTAVIATHPHADHIGGLPYVLTHIPVKTVYLCNVATSTRTFEKFIEAVVQSGAKRVQARPGAKLDLQGMECVFYGPVREYEDLNNASAVFKLSYGSTEFLFMGDAEQEAISDILAQNGTSLQADVLKAAHHGSFDGINSKLLQTVKPKHAVILCGKSNEYGHPHTETLKLLGQAKVAVYRTDEAGHIIAESDGANITFKAPAAESFAEKKPEKAAVAAKKKEEAADIGSDIVPIFITKTGKKYHVEGCSGLSRSKIPITLKEAKARGYGPCGNCNPPE